VRITDRLGDPVKPKRYLAVLALLTTTFIWGTTFVATKVALAVVGPFMLTLLRFVFASLVLLPLAWAEHRARRPVWAWRPLLLAGLVGGCLYFSLQNLGMVYTTATKASLILGGVPAMIALLSALALGERIGLWRALGIAASIGGVAIIVLAGQGATWAGGQWLGDLLIVATGLSWAVYTIVTKGHEGRVSPTQVSAATVGLGALFLVPLTGYEVLARPAAWPTPLAWLAIGYLGFVASTAPFLLWNYALTQVDASEAAVYINLVPLVAVLSSILLLHETVAPGQWLGGALVLAGVWAAGRKPERSAETCEV
jgi:drug/metabolite transporter (DMT)-like permease